MAAMVWSASQWELHLTWYRNGELTSMHLLCTERIWEGFEENAIGVVMSVLCINWFKCENFSARICVSITYVRMPIGSQGHVAASDRPLGRASKPNDADSRRMRRRSLSIQQSGDSNFSILLEGVIR